MLVAVVNAAIRQQLLKAHGKKLTEFASRVECKRRVRNETTDGGDVEDPSASRGGVALPEVAHRCATDADGVPEVHLELVACHGLVYRLDDAVHGVSRVIEHDVEPAEVRCSLRDKGLPRLRGGSGRVVLEDEKARGTVLCKERCKRGREGAAGCSCHTFAGGEDGFRGGQTDSGRGPCHYRMIRELVRKRRP